MDCIEISHCQQNSIYEKPNIFAIGAVVFAPHSQTYATELKKYSIVFVIYFGVLFYWGN
jgi:hypothetical protein